MDGWTDGRHPPSLGETPKPLTHHQALPCIKTCLWFRVCDLPPPQRKGGSIASDILTGKKKFLNAAFLQCFEAESAYRDACAKSVAFHIRPSRKKKKKKQIHLANTGGWQGDGRAAIATGWCFYSSCPVALVWFQWKKDMKVIIWNSLLLREKLYLIP